MSYDLGRLGPKVFLPMKLRYSHILLSLPCIGLVALRAEPGPNGELQGAVVLLQAAALAKSPEPAPEDNMKEFAAFVSAARELRRERNALEPAAAAQRWEQLCAQLPRLKVDYESGVGPQDLITVLLGALPRPESWPLIGRIPDRVSAEGNAAPLHNPGRMSAGKKIPGIHLLLPLLLTGQFDEAEAMCKSSPDIVRVVHELRSKLQAPAFEAAAEAALAAGAEQTYAVPDILPRMGEEKSKAVATRLLLKPVEFGTISGAGTLELLRATALAHVAELPRAPWELCGDPSAAPLYDALVARFGDPLAGVPAAAGDWRVESRRRAAAVAMVSRALNCFLKGDKDQAGRLLIQVCEAFPEGPGYGADLEGLASDWGLAPKVAYGFLRPIAARTRAPWLLKAVIEDAPAAGQVEDALGLLVSSGSGPINLLDQLRLHELELRLRLAQGDRAKAFAVLGTALALEVPAAAADAAPEESGFGLLFGRKDSPVAIQLRLIERGVTLGLLLERDELVGVSLTALQRVAAAFPPERSGDILQGVLTSLADSLAKAGRLSEAERLFAQALQRAAADREHEWGSAAILAGLVRLYDRANRSADVLALFEQAPQWSERDLGEMSGDADLWLCAARAYAAVPATRGKAAPLVKRYMEKAPADDDGYTLLLDLEGEQALPFIESLIARDRWEERPLIWKAEMLRRLGRLPDAELAARAALALDPTDGEQPPGKRVRGYAVLAAILDDEGRAEDATLFHRVVESVHIAERGDALRSAGLVGDALAAYESAEAHFADAYCIQWRLAERLRQEGREAEAEKHYELAFARMPEQFGRMANLCFGCENIFGSKSGRSAADRVLSRLAALPNPQPQALLILARLRVQQNRPSEAYTLLQRAVQLDNRYLDAWNELISLATKTDAPAAERRQIVLRLLELDPKGTHCAFGGGDLFAVGPERLWLLLQDGLDRPMVPGELLPLPAAVRRLDAQNTAAKSAVGREEQRRQLFGEFLRPALGNEPDGKFIEMLMPTAFYCVSFDRQ